MMNRRGVNPGRPQIADKLLFDVQNECTKPDAVTNYRSTDVQLKWAVKGWCFSPEAIQFYKNPNVSSVIKSPVLVSSEDSKWQFVIRFFRGSSTDLTTTIAQLLFRCYYQGMPNYTDIIFVKGNFSVNFGPNAAINDSRSFSRVMSVNGFVEIPEKKEPLILCKLPEDVTLSINLKIGGFEGTTQRSSQPRARPFPSNDMSLLALDKSFADLTIVVRGVEFTAHKAVLATKSKVLATMLSTDTREKTEGKIVLDDVSEAAWRLFQNYLYSNSYDPKSDTKIEVLIEVLMLADKYEVPPDDVELVLLKRLSLSNVLEIYEAVEKFKTPNVKTAATKLIAENWEMMKKEKRVLEWMAAGSDLATMIVDKLQI